MKIAGMLSPTTDVEDLAKRAFVHLGWRLRRVARIVAGGKGGRRSSAARSKMRVSRRNSPRIGGRSPSLRAVRPVKKWSNERSSSEIKESAPILADEGSPGASIGASARRAKPSQSAKLPLAALLAVPVAAALALAVHLVVSKKELPVETRSYTSFLLAVFWAASGRRGRATLVAGLATLDARHVSRSSLPRSCCSVRGKSITAGLRLLPLPYFPGPAGVFCKA